MLVSIVINNFNYGRYLAQAIDSALHQTWPNVEVIVVDDGSTDDSKQVLAAYRQKLRTILQNNLGQGAAISTGFAASSGEAVIFLDSDDTLDADIASRAATVLQTDGNVARVQWPMRFVDAEGVSDGRLTPSPQSMVSGDLSSHIIRYRSHAWPPTSGSAYARAALEPLMPIPPEYRWGSDLYLAETTPFYGKVVSLPHPGGNYRVHGSNNWTGANHDVANLRERIEWTIRNHEHVRKAAARSGKAAPEKVTAALDVAFLSQRLASHRLDPENHPIPGDTRRALLPRALRAAVRHPHHTAAHRAKRVVWLLGVGIGPERLAKNLVDRFYFRR